MSGGSWDYFYSTLGDVAERLKRTDTQTSEWMLRRALGELLEKCANAMHAIEWVDSSDWGRGDEVKAICACFVRPEDEEVRQLSKVVEDLRVIADKLTERGGK